MEAGTSCERVDGMRQLVFLVEEMSMKIVLDALLPYIVPESISFITIPHEGKSDLQKSIPIKLRSWRQEGVKFVIVHDKDSCDCKELKKHLMELCRQAGRPETLVRIVCSSLESWYLGDLKAVGDAYGILNISRLMYKAKFREPDKLENAEQELRRIVETYQKISGAKSISYYMDIERNVSHSFKVFIEGIKRVCG